MQDLVEVLLVLAINILVTRVCWQVPRAGHKKRMMKYALIKLESRDCFFLTWLFYTSV